MIYIRIFPFTSFLESRNVMNIKRYKTAPPSPRISETRVGADTGCAVCSPYATGDAIGLFYGV